MQQLATCRAAPITSVNDVLHELGLADTSEQTTLFGSTPEQHALLQLLTEGVRAGDDLQTKSGLDAATFGQTMTMLEIEGKIRALGANQWMIR